MMRVQEIVIKKLFNSFEYHIKMNLEDRATILISPNGFGKTTILKMIDSLINWKFSFFFKIPFTEFLIYFDDGSFIQVEKRLPENESSNSFPIVNIIISRGEFKKYINLSRIYHPDNDFYRKYSTLLEDKFEHNRKVGDVQRSFEMLDAYDEILQKLKNRPFEEEVIPSFPPTLASKLPSNGLIKNELDEILKITEATNVFYIKTERLLALRSERLRKAEVDVPFVSLYAENIVHEISEKLAESAEISHKLDSTFPIRVIEKAADKDLISYHEDLEEQLKQIRNKQNYLKQVGIFDESTHEIELPPSISKENSSIRAVLAEYVKDTQEKFAVFDQLSNKLELFISTINKRFGPGKKLEILRDKGFVIRMPNGSVLSAEELSSGEQHQIVLFYRLLFEVTNGSLVMIDEPELSLHIAWQQEFLDDVINIAKLNNFDLLVTTHSPDIIHNHWSLIVDLAGEVKNT